MITGMQTYSEALSSYFKLKTPPKGLPQNDLAVAEKTEQEDFRQKGLIRVNPNFFVVLSRSTPLGRSISPDLEVS